MLTFDIVQLSFLLALTGGLNNPFALLILAPVAISAMALKPVTTAYIAGASLCLVAMLSVFHVPLTTSDGVVFEKTAMFLYGFLISIAIGIVFLAVYADV